MTKRKDADTRFRELIDLYNCVDVVYKEFDREREALRKKLRNIIKRRGRGTHNGFESSINAYDAKRLVLSADKVRELLTPKQFNGCFRTSKYIQIDGGPLLPDSKLEPDMGPPHEMKE